MWSKIIPTFAQDAKDKAYTYDILALLVSTLTKLESDDGDVSVCNQTIKVREALALFSADNLGYHSLIGFLENFNARKFCGLCEATKDENQTKFDETDYVKRIKESYDESVNSLGQLGYKEPDTGLKYECILTY